MIILSHWRLNSRNESSHKFIDFVLKKSLSMSHSTIRIDDVEIGLISSIKNVKSTDSDGLQGAFLYNI